MLIPASGKDVRTVSTGDGTGNGTCAGPGCVGFEELLNRDGISLSRTNEYGQGLLLSLIHISSAMRVGRAAIPGSLLRTASTNPFPASMIQVLSLIHI